MGESINFLDSVPKVVRDIDARKANKEANRQAALRFGHAYFDGTREQGYGGYIYDGRWQKIAARLIEHYGLKAGDRVLDVGCAKGFLVHDLRAALPGLEVWGVDISEYALAQVCPDAGPYVMRADCRSLPFEGTYFDLVLAFNTIHNLVHEECALALREIVRVSRGSAFVQVDSYRDDSERDVFEDWMLTARTYLKPDGWREMFAASEYKGDYYWTILQGDGSNA
jgi:SAM-dependent methyltransferase